MRGFPPPPGKRVDRTNAIMTPPYNRWSYLHMRTIFPSAKVANGSATGALMVDSDPSIAELAVRRPNGGIADLPTFLRETYTDAFLVVTPDGLAHESYFNGMDSAQPHQMMSVTKSFAGLFALMAAADGQIEEGRPITDVVPELGAASAFDGATIGQVLDMVNSMDFSEDYADPSSGIVRYAQVLGWLEGPPDGPQHDSLYDFLVGLEKDPRFDHGEVFHYQTPKTDVVNWITNRVTGKSFQDQMSDVLWAPLGAEAETYVLLDRSGTLVAGGGLNAAPHDLARFAMMLLNDGRVGRKQIVDPAIISVIEKGGSRSAFSNGPDAIGFWASGEWSYRAQWWIRHAPGREAFSAIGIHGQWIYVDRRRGVAIIKQSSQPVSADPAADEFVINACDAVIDLLAST